MSTVDPQQLTRLFGRFIGTVIEHLPDLTEEEMSFWRERKNEKYLRQALSQALKLPPNWFLPLDQFKGNRLTRHTLNFIIRKGFTIVGDLVVINMSLMPDCYTKSNHPDFEESVLREINSLLVELELPPLKIGF